MRDLTSLAQMQLGALSRSGIWRTMPRSLAWNGLANPEQIGKHSDALGGARKLSYTCFILPVVGS